METESVGETSIEAELFQVFQSQISGDHRMPQILAMLCRYPNLPGDPTPKPIRRRNIEREKPPQVKTLRTARAGEWLRFRCLAAWLVP